MAVAIVVFTAASLGLKWVVAVTLGIVGLFALPLFAGKLKPVLLLTAVFLLPVRLNFHPIFKETYYVQLKGLPISLFDLVFAFLFIHWVLQLLLGRERLRFFPAISLPALGYILLAGLSTLRSQDMVLSLIMLLLIVKAYLIFLYFANNIKTETEIYLIVGVLALTIFMQSFIGILQYVTGGTLGLGVIFGETEHTFKTFTAGFSQLSRVGGTIGSANSLAMYLNFTLPLLLCFLFTSASSTSRIFVGLSFVLGCLTELLTLSRGGWVALTFAVMVVFYGVFKERLKSRLKSLVVMAIGISFVVVVTIGLFTSVRTRLFEDDYGAAYSRIPMMQVAFNIIKDNPFLGVGLNNYTTVMNRYDRTRENISYTFPFPVHNAFLIIAAESGILALFCFLGILLGVYSKAWLFFRGKDRILSLLGLGSFCGILTWIIHAQFKMDLASVNIALWFSFALVAAIHQMLQNNSLVSDSSVKRYQPVYPAKD
jgi:O-antigen ligase